MGYRHQVISDTMVPAYYALPEWFIEKYKEIIDFKRDYWASYTEYKRYGVLSEFNEDVQRVVKELDNLGELSLPEIRLVYFADESDSDNPDISHVTITKDSIIEIRPTLWEEYKYWEE